MNLDEREGWIELVNLVESRADSTIVINTGARNQTGVSNFGRTLSKALGELGRKLVVLWMIDRKRESLELLSDFMAAIPEAEVHVVRNLYLGSEKKFELYNGSKMKSGIEGKGKQVHQPAGARRSRDRRHEQGADDDRESNRRAVAGRSDGAGTVAGRMRRHAVAGRQWLNSRTRSKQLLDRQPTDGERQRLYRARDALNIKPTDAVWRLLMVLEHYQTMYEEIPRQIAEAARNATEAIRATAEAQAKAAREETKKGLMKAVTEAVRVTAKQHARAEHFKWVSAAVSIVSIMFLAVGWGENRRGQAQGLAAGESRAKAECAYATKLSSWALTPDGTRASSWRTR